MEQYIDHELNRELVKKLFGAVKLYETSVTNLGDCTLAMIKRGTKRYLLAEGQGPLFEELEGKVSESFKLAPLTHENRLVLNKYFPYTIPMANIKKKNSIGLGDRLGEATFGHIKALKNSDAFPIFAQQSIRELTFTKRTYAQVIDCAAFAVFQEGYTSGYGADGDHLKKAEEITQELALGATMITLDSSEKIDNEIINLTPTQVKKQYENLPEDIRTYYESEYQEKTFALGDGFLQLEPLQLKKDILTYYKAIDFIEEIYTSIIQKSETPLDFEISIDETSTPTLPVSHLLIALELKRRNIHISTLAPRFVGEFQKGIDYIGDLDFFEEDLTKHITIAQTFGYRLSIHSGSDKFSIFPILAKTIKGSFHVKTAGTNWLEALRLVALKDAQLYRKIHTHALERFMDATNFYHVTTDLSAIKPLSEVSDAELPTYLNDNNARQLLHITFGYVLQDKDEKGAFLFRDRLYTLLSEEEEAYKELLAQHIGKHLELLEFNKKL